MSSLILPCPHCSQSLQFDRQSLPDQPATFSCPRCKKTVVVDKRELLNTESPEAMAPSATPPPAATADRRFTRIPADAKFPSGIILGEDEAVIVELKEKLAALGSEVERLSSADAARQVIIDEQPDLCIYVGGNIPAPPYAPMAPLTGLPPSIRRRLYLVLVSDNLKTLDGNAAFLYQVNMILGKQDFPQLGAALYGGIDYHDRLYRTYFQAIERKGSI